MKAATKTKPKDAKGTSASSLGLEGLGDLSSLLEQPKPLAAQGLPIELDLDLIDEDPEQPREADNPGFSEESLEDLARTIKARGVKTPISVRENPSSPGRFIINHGARRYRASKRAGRTTIPAFVDNDYNKVDQVIENLQRNDLTAREVANFIGRELAAGKKKGEIADALGKSPAFVSQHVTLLDLPDPVADAFNSGRTGDVTVVNELVKAYKANPDQVTDWLANESQEITRGTVKDLREYLDQPPGGKEGQKGAGDDPVDDDSPEDGETTKPEKKEEDPTKLKKAIVQVTHDDRPARLLLNRRPSAEGFAWLKYDDDGHEFETELSSVQLVAVLEG